MPKKSIANNKEMIPQLVLPSINNYPTCKIVINKCQVQQIPIPAPRNGFAIIESLYTSQLGIVLHDASARTDFGAPPTKIGANSD